LPSVVVWVLLDSERFLQLAGPIRLAFGCQSCRPGCAVGGTAPGRDPGHWGEATPQGTGMSFGGGPATPGARYHWGDGFAAGTARFVTVIDLDGPRRIGTFPYLPQPTAMLGDGFLHRCTEPGGRIVGVLRMAAAWGAFRSSRGTYYLWVWVGEVKEKQSKATAIALCVVGGPSPASRV